MKAKQFSFVTCAGVLLWSALAVAQVPESGEACNPSSSPARQASCFLGRRDLGPVLQDLLRSNPTYSIPDDANKNLFQRYLQNTYVYEHEIGGSLSAVIEGAQYFVVDLLDHETFERDEARGEAGFRIRADGRVTETRNIAHSRVKIVELPSNAAIYVAVSADESDDHYRSFDNPKAARDRKMVDTREVDSSQLLRKLALVYIAASIRSGQWLIPGFRHVMDSRVRESNRRRYTLAPKQWFAMVGGVLESLQLLKSPKEGSSLLVGKKIEFQLGAAYDEVEEELIKGRLTLRLVQFTKPDGTIIEGYGATYLMDLITTGRYKLLGLLEGAEVAGVRAYVAEYYPLADSVPTVPVPIQPIRSGSGQGSKGHHSGLRVQDNLVTPATATAVYEAVFSFINKMRRNKKVVSLQVVSEPSEASVDLRTDYEKALRTTVTDAPLTNLPRGLYSYLIKKSGFKTIAKPINLVDESGTVLRCKLYRQEDAEGPYPCSLK